MMSIVDLSLLDWALSLAGGGLIGLGAGGLMLAFGQIAGVSGLIAQAFSGKRDAALFLIGLPLGVLLVGLLGEQAVPTAFASPGRLILAGLLVGFGARLSNGCTSGHGVCGLARLSPRSLAATGVFMTAGVVTVALVGGVSP